MPPFRVTLRLASSKPLKPSLKQAVRQQLAARASGRELPTIPECPSPTCECAEMPPDLDIETERKLNGTMPAHSEHVIICTGQADWKSRIEDEKDTAPWGEVVSSIKTLLGPKGRLHDVGWLCSVNSVSLTYPSAISKRRREHLLVRAYPRPTSCSSRVSGFQSYITSSTLRVECRQFSRILRPSRSETIDRAARAEEKVSGRPTEGKIASTGSRKPHLHTNNSGVQSQFERLTLRHSRPSSPSRILSIHQ